MRRRGQESFPGSPAPKPRTNPRTNLPRPLIIYATFHPAAPSSPLSLRTRLTCFLRGHSYILSRPYFPHADLLCTRCGLLTLTQYLRRPYNTVTLPIQDQAINH